MEMLISYLYQSIKNNNYSVGIMKCKVSEAKPFGYNGTYDDYIESIASFCSFATGVCADGNHEMRYITTHPMIDAGQTSYVEKDYLCFQDKPWYFSGVHPRKNDRKHKRSMIGNDVWLGVNVVITNGADIGNGVIAGANAVITTDIPDYAVVGGVPARIIRYRYTETQSEQLNKIGWWNWTDEEIRGRFDDFYLPINEFIQKYI